MSSFIEFLSMPDVEMIGMGLRWASQVLRYLPGGKHVFEENNGVMALEVSAEVFVTFLSV